MITFDILRKGILHLYLGHIVTSYSLRMSRCEKKTVFEYNSLKDFRYRKKDSIWDQERWVYSEYYMPCLGKPVSVTSSVLLELESIFSAEIQVLGALERNYWDVLYLRAPCHLLEYRTVNSGLRTIYSAEKKGRFFVIDGILDKSLSPVHSGQEIGCFLSKSCVYLIEVKSNNIFFQ